MQRACPSSRCRSLTLTRYLITCAAGLASRGMAGELGAITGLSETGSAALRAVAAAMRGFDQSDAPWTVLATLLLDRTRIAARIGGSSDIAERTRGLAIWQFMNFLRVQPGGKGSLLFGSLIGCADLFG